MTFKHFIRTSDDWIGGINTLRGLWWAGVLTFTAIGALCYWGARALKMEDFYGMACLFMGLALICVCLGGAAP